MEKTQSRGLDITSIMKEEDISAISKISEIKKDITSYFDMNLFISHMKELIDESEHFDFRSKTAKAYIDTTSPTFIIKYTSKEIEEKLKSFKGNPDEVESKQVDYITHMITRDIITKFSVFITDCIKDEAKLDNLFLGLPEDIKEFFISNIYTIRANIKDNNIYIIYFI